MFLSLLLLLGCRETLAPNTVPTSTAEDDWERLLGEVVTSDGYVDYDMLEAERAVLDTYVAWIAEDDRAQDRITADNHHFYLNAYNALVLWQVLERDRPDSVLDVGSLLPTQGAGFFVTTQFEVARDRLSLSEIRHERIRQLELYWREHAAMTWGARSGPPLRPELYKKKQLAEQLRDQMSVWVDDPDRGLRIEDGKVLFNPIFDWHARDFDFWSAGQDLCELTARYASDPLKQKLEAASKKGCPHDFFEFDWALNTPPAASANP